MYFLDASVADHEAPHGWRKVWELQSVSWGPVDALMKEYGVDDDTRAMLAPIPCVNSWCGEELEVTDPHAPSAMGEARMLLCIEGAPGEWKKPPERRHGDDFNLINRPEETRLVNVYWKDLPADVTLATRGVRVPKRLQDSEVKGWVEEFWGVGNKYEVETWKAVK